MMQRETVKVNEEELRTIMAGDIPSYRERAKLTEAIKGNTNESDKVDLNTSVDTTNESTKLPLTVKTDKSVVDYRYEFLRKPPSEHRRQTYVSRELHEMIMSFLPVIAPGVTFPEFLGNVLYHHIENYKEEIKKEFNENCKWRDK